MLLSLICDRLDGLLGQKCNFCLVLCAVALCKAWNITLYNHLQQIRNILKNILLIWLYYNECLFFLPFNSDWLQMLYQIIFYPNICTPNAPSVATLIRQMLIDLDVALLLLPFTISTGSYTDLGSRDLHGIANNILNDITACLIFVFFIHTSFPLNGDFKVASANYGWLNAFSIY